MCKNRKIFDIILFIIVVAIEIYCLLTFAECIKLLNTESMSALAIIALLPLYIIGTAIILILTIIITILTKKITKTLQANNLATPKYIKIINILSWVIILVNIALYFSLYII